MAQTRPASFLERASPFDSRITLTERLIPVLEHLSTARPTAVNLGAALGRLRECLVAGCAACQDVSTIIRSMIDECRQIADEDVGRNVAMAKWGADWLVKRVRASDGTGTRLNVLTVCNTGSLATSAFFCWIPVVRCF
jgi:methylthioribose-1-phosphate isomerase